MTGRQQIEQYIRDHHDPASIPQDRFEAATKGKIRCVLCGREGYGPAQYNPAATYPQRSRTEHRILLQFFGEHLVRVEGPDTEPEPAQPMPWWVQLSKWQIGCLMDHVWPCSCGLRFRDYATLWRHIGADRPAGWGRQGEHQPALACEVTS